MRTRMSQGLFHSQHLGIQLPPRAQRYKISVSERELSTRYPSIGRDHAVVCKDENNGKSNNGFPSAKCTRVNSVDNCDNKLAESAEYQSNCQEESAASNASDDCDVDQDGDYADCSENAAVLEGVADIGHFEEISSVG